MEFKKHGFKAGLEIHQQLDTGKLFCSCPNILRRERPDFKIERNLRAIAGETGEIDAAAKHAQEKGLSYVYEGYNDTTCLVELDEEPPHAVNSEAFETALVLAIILKCSIPDYVQVMRKTVVDGSNTSGFQRTMLIGTNGVLNVHGNKILIESICLEEDAARRTAEDKNSVTYRLDRLGIPLIEIATGPDIKNPIQARDVALRIGMLLRATGKAMRGIGTIRQDVNISIDGHPRVELKGFQDLKMMPLTIEKEVERQESEVGKNPQGHVRNVKPLLKKAAAENKIESHVRNVLADSTSKYLRPMPGAARMYPETDIPLIKITPEMIVSAQNKIPEDPEIKFERYAKLTNSDYAGKILFSEQEALFNRLVKKLKLKPLFIAETIFSFTKEAVRKAGQEYGKFPDELIEDVLTLLDTGKITKESLSDILIDLASGKELNSIIENYSVADRKELEKLIKNVIAQNKSAPEGKLQGIVIGALKSKAPVPEIIQVFKNIIA